MNIGNTFYHGGTESDIKILVKNGVDLSRTQQRDHGFFGDGFYVARYPDTAECYGEARAEVRVHNGAQMFNAGETFPEDGSIVPQCDPSWHEDFLNWYQTQVAAQFKDRWEDTIKPSVTPSASGFDRKKWYTKVTAYAAAQGYPIIYWSDSEIIIRDTSIVTDIKRCR